MNGEIQMTLYAEHAGPPDDTGDIDLEYTRGVRKKIVSKICEKGIPDDLESKALLLKVLDGISKDAMGKKKIKSEEKTAGAAANAAVLVAEFLNRTKSTAVPIPVDFVPPTLGDEIPVPPLVDGQTSTIVANETYYEFAKRTGLVKDPTQTKNEVDTSEDSDI